MRKAGDRTRKKILDTAVKIFAEKGFLVARVSDISKEAGIAHGLLYYYFKNKEDILQAIFEENWKDMAENINNVIEHYVDVRERINAIISFIFHLFHNHPDLFRVLVTNLSYNPAEKQFIRGELLKDFLDPLYELFKQGQLEGDFRKDIDPEVAIQILFGMVENSIRSLLIGITSFEIDLKSLLIIKDNIIKIFFDGTAKQK